MPEFTLTDARFEHIPAMVGLLRELFSEEQDFEPSYTRQATALELIVNQPAHGRVFVAVAGHGAIGMISLLFTISTAAGGYAAWVEDLVVASAMRGKGVGSALLEHAVAWARREGLTRLTLLTDRRNEQAQRLYARNGFVLSQMIPLRLGLR
jgi:GNAT superfamily N-acetyltransferase